jgi:hypothetical protein
LNCEVIEVLLLRAILKFVNIDGNGKAVIVLPVSKSFFVLEKVQFVNPDVLKEFRKTEAFTVEKLFEELELLSDTQIIFDRKTFESYNNLLSNSIDESNRLIVFEENMASIIAKNYN